jgi:hypothetical protein
MTKRWSFRAGGRGAAEGTRLSDGGDWLDLPFGWGPNWAAFLGDIATFILPIFTYFIISHFSYYSSYRFKSKRVGTEVKIGVEVISDEASKLSPILGAGSIPLCINEILRTSFEPRNDNRTLSVVPSNIQADVARVHAVSKIEFASLLRPPFLLPLVAFRNRKPYGSINYQNCWQVEMVRFKVLYCFTLVSPMPLLNLQTRTAGSLLSSSRPPRQLPLLPRRYQERTYSTR